MKWLEYSGERLNGAWFKGNDGRYMQVSFRNIHGHWSVADSRMYPNTDAGLMHIAWADVPHGTSVQLYAVKESNVFSIIHLHCDSFQTCPK